MTARRPLRVVAAHATSDGAGVQLRRSLGGPELDHVDPFLLLDEFKSEVGSDYVGGFPDHPHRGFETVTYMLAGSMAHADHKGNRGTLVPGSVQWMTAGRGIIHSEMPRQEQGLMWGFQLWVNLPARDKMTAPRYQEFPPDRIPSWEGDGVRVRVIAGESGGTKGAVHGIATDPLYLDVTLPAGHVFRQDVTVGHNALCYVFEGAAEVGRDSSAGAPPSASPGASVTAGHLVVLGDGDHVEVAAGPKGARFLLLAARPLGEPIARYGPFVMNTRAEVMQAVRDFQSGTF